MAGAGLRGDGAVREWFKRDPALTPGRALALISVLVLAGLLRGLELNEKGLGHAYYGATTYAMMQSPSNFWFAAAEPGASVMVDKPPLGFMLQAAAAWIFGFNWFSLGLPQLIAGMLSVTALHALVGRRFGFWAGIAASAALAVTPVAAMLDRTNLLDSTLALTQIFGVGFGLRAAETGRTRPLMWAMVWFGLGFNIKMLQAAFAVPGVVMAFLLAAPVPVRTRIERLTLVGLVYVVVAFGWAVSVELTPPEQRPWIGSTFNNSMAELIFDYNGVIRASGSTDGSGGGIALRGLREFFREPLRLFSGGFYYGGGFFVPAALAGLAGIWATWRPRKRLSEPYLSAMVWGVWFAAGAVFLTGAGFIHSYYAIIYAVPAAALTGISAGLLMRQKTGRSAVWLAGCAVLAGLPLLLALRDGYLPIWWAIPTGGLAGAIVLLAVRKRPAALVVSAAAAAFSPFVFTGLTSHMALHRVTPEPFGGTQTRQWLETNDAERLDYHPDALAWLMAHTEETEYLVAVPHAQLGAPYVVHSGRAVLYIGGFAGRDTWIGVDGLRQMIDDGALRYVYAPVTFDARRPEIREWATTECRLVFGIDLTPPVIRVVDGERVYENNTPRDIDSLYDCAPR